MSVKSSEGIEGSSTACLSNSVQRRDVFSVPSSCCQLIQSCGKCGCGMQKRWDVVDQIPSYVGLNPPED